ncbi:MAG: hypothetical protein ACRC2S_08385 [Waterburya sp.]
MITLNRKIIPTSAIITLTATLITVAQPQPASAQLLEVAAGALNALIRSKEPQPQVIQQPVPVPVPTPVQPSRPEFSVGTDNGNGNNFNLCISNCLPPDTATAPMPSPMPSPIPTGIPAPMAAPSPMVLPPRVVPTVPTPVPAPPIAQQQGTVSSSTIINPNAAVSGTSTSQNTQQSSTQSAIVQN